MEAERLHCLILFARTRVEIYNLLFKYGFCLFRELKRFYDKSELTLDDWKFKFITDIVEH